MIDSGLDYTHQALRGAGTVHLYLQPFGTSGAMYVKNTVRDGMFPTDRVIHGIDFVGDAVVFKDGLFPNSSFSDDNPIDSNGHGTLVASIILARVVYQERCRCANANALVQLEVRCCKSTKMEGSHSSAWLGLAWLGSNVYGMMQQRTNATRATKVQSQSAWDRQRGRQNEFKFLS